MLFVCELTGKYVSVDKICAYAEKNGIDAKELLSEKIKDVLGLDAEFDRILGGENS